jgi:hypothetical protein
MVNIKDIPEFEADYDCCKICQYYEVDKSLLYYTKEYKYYLGNCMINDDFTAENSTVEDFYICNFFEKEE